MNVGSPAEKGLHGLQTGWADVTGGDRRGWIAVRQNGGLATEGVTAIQNFCASTCELRDPLRALILNALAGSHDKGAWLLKRRRRKLIVTADRRRRIGTERRNPPVEHPGRMCCDG